MQKYVIALYIRLSIEDYKYDSLSIENQSLVLHEYAASMPEALNAEIVEFIDNGYSGTSIRAKTVPTATAKAPMAEWSLTRRLLPLCSSSSSLPPRASTPPPSRESCSAEKSPPSASTKRRTAIIPAIFPAVTGFGVHPPFSAFWRTNATPACM